MRDQSSLLADCSSFRRWTAADGPGMPKIRLAPPSALTCDVQHGQHEEVTKHLRFLQQCKFKVGEQGGNFGSHHQRRLHVTCSAASMRRSDHLACSCNTANFRCGNIADMKPPARGSLRTTDAMRDQSGLLADCSSFRRWTAADGPGMPKIRLAPPSALTCDVQHGQHEEVTKHTPVLAQ